MITLTHVGFHGTATARIRTQGGLRPTQHGDVQYIYVSTRTARRLNALACPSAAGSSCTCGESMAEDLDGSGTRWIVRCSPDGRISGQYGRQS